MSNFFDEFYTELGGDSLKFYKKYNYGGELTKRLDDLKSSDLDIRTLYEIILWKVNRFPEIDSEILEEVKALGDLSPNQDKSYEQAKPVLEKLLRIKGFRLPMASTLLRFINPNVFQIIDVRANRVIYGKRKTSIPNVTAKSSQKQIDKAIEYYFKYLNTLHRRSSPEFPFHLADRLLYLLDIQREKEDKRKKT
jgi:hypothetical protein